ncbi:MAG: electron transport complex subunit RsxG [Gammaproteobacteria bacterium]|nr:electron transport complex subunit RsxG [Gammaproteobacteria bacterium]
MDIRQGSAWRTLLLVGLVATGAAVLVTASHELSRERIAANERARLLASLNSVLDPRLQDRGLVPIRITATDRELLGTDEPVDVFVATEGGRPVAAILAPVAPDGYNAPIRLLVGVTPGGVLTGVRVLSHRETPGLGDLIELRKSGWILQFDGRSLEDPPYELWAVDRDDGAFDSITGATVTPRAVVKAVRNTLVYFERHREELFAAAARASEAEAAEAEE